jgi:pimeloyl-ACP methyl ester carboxylesterase
MVPERSEASIRNVSIRGHGGVNLVGDEYHPAHRVGPAVILLHGGAQTRHSWGQVPTRLAADGFLTLAVDLRGHGESSWAPEADYSPEALRSDAERMAAHIGTPVVIVGASLGGLVSLLFSSAHPDQVAHLVLVDVVPRNNPGGVERIRQFMSGNPEGFETFEDAVGAVAAYQKHRPRPSEPVGLWRNLRRAPNGRLVWHWDPDFLLRDGLPWTHLKEDILVAEASRLKVRTTLLIGGDSDVVDEPAAAAFREMVPNAEVVVVPGASHMIAGDNNEMFGSELLRICREALQLSRPDPSAADAILDIQTDK